jgi:dTDP-4-amino-4,6-dideoxygalactose transaminase
MQETQESLYWENAMKNVGKMQVGVGDFQANAKMRNYVLDVLESGRLSYGPYLTQFEKEFARLHNCDYGIMCNSGTSALQVALQTLKIAHAWEDGDEVIIPATTFVATANIVLHNRLTPVFVDVEADYFEINVELIEEKITPRTRCIIPVHLFGMPCQMDTLMTIAQKYNLKVIEDSCETMFAEFNQQRVGSIGDMGCFSTYVAHILITGVGGLVITSNPDYAVTIRSLINHGRDSIYISIDDDKEKTHEQMKKIIERRFSFIHCGHSFRITELEGAIGLAQLEEWESNIKKRQSNAHYLTQQLSQFQNKLQLPQIRPLATHVFMMYPLVLKNESKQALCEHLENCGVETRDMLPLINQPFYQEYFNNPEKDYPVSTKILEQGFYIGCHPYMTSDMREHVVQSFQDYFTSH